MTDSTSMKTIAVLTLVFLPATFVASMFSMAVFPATSPDLFWTYWAVTIPLTLIVFALWFGWWYLRAAQPRYDKFPQSDVKPFSTWQRKSDANKRAATTDPTAYIRRRVIGDLNRPWLQDCDESVQQQPEKQASMV